MNLQEMFELMSIIGNYQFEDGLQQVFPNSKHIYVVDEFGNDVDFYVDVTTGLFYAVFVNYNGKSYGWMIPFYIDAWDKYWDNSESDYIETSFDDMVEKVRSIAHKTPFDSRVDIELEMTDEEFITIAKAAHKQDITFNKFIENSIQAVIDNYREEE